MRRTVATLALLLSVVAMRVDAQVPTARVGSDSLHHLIAGFLADPVANGLRYREILDSADKSPFVTVTINAGVAPWLCAHSTDPMMRSVEGVLLGAFVAGNMRAQLDSGVKRDHALAGVLAVLQVYGALKTRLPQLSIAAIDGWQEAQRAGTLEAVIAAISAHPPADCGK